MADARYFLRNTRRLPCVVCGAILPCYTAADENAGAGHYYHAPIRDHRHIPIVVEQREDAGGMATGPIEELPPGLLAITYNLSAATRAAWPAIGQQGEP